MIFVATFFLYDSCEIAYFFLGSLLPGSSNWLGFRYFGDQQSFLVV